MYKVKRFSVGDNEDIDHLSEDQVQIPSSESDLKGINKMLGVSSALGLGVVGKSALDDAYRSGELTGRMHFYHTTNNKNVDSILEEGLLGSKSLDPNSPSNKELDNVNLKSGKKMVFLSKNREAADKMRDYHGRGNSQTLNVNIPYDEYKKMKLVDVNPEFRGAKTFKEYYDRAIRESDMPDNPTMRKAMEEYMKKDLKHYWDTFSGKKGSPGTRIIEGDISPEFIKQSSKYKRNSLSQIGRYIKNNPGRFLKGLGKTSLGASMVGGGGYLAYRSLVPGSSSNHSSESENQDIDPTDAIEN